ncbi:Putative Dual specificity protein kinase lkh1 [[Torrubiella] hemipterigena]|uniref:dual-specificity kinase n=1 Tax=[Torrubiella] hemipterigena TaxID=1531966 RepID=A0A0A1SNN6_9HYPO|nr:Putative Dual specificity protein kinase lkh1 [[Torrubiella] hemipterigena]
MSTPSTAVATLPQYPQHRQFQPPFTSHYKLEHYSSPTLAATTASAKDLPPPHSPASRYLPYYQSAASAASPTDGVAHAQSSVPPRPPPHVYLESSSSNAATHRHPGDSISSSMTSATMTAVDHHGLDQSASKKRRRDSHGPDWNHFYRNGLPDEVIVIDDDSPEPEANTSRRITNGTSSQMLPHDGSRGQPAKKRRRDDEHRPGYHIQYLHSHAGTPQYNTTPLGSTLSSDHASLTTTAPTSLSSTSLHDDVPAPLKRKRTTRQQAADEAKRRDVDGLGDPVMTYMPPPYPPKKAGEVTVRVVTDKARSHEKAAKIDDDDGHYIVVPDADLTERYQISRLLGQGTFGKVVEARDRRRNKAVAVKIIRSVQKYRDASRIELRVLATLRANDEENRNRCIHLRDCFDYRGHICIVTDLLGQSVFDFLKGNGFVPFPNSQIQSFARQLLTSVAFLHDLNLIHTDLKPENILLKAQNYQTFTYNRNIPSSSTTINRHATQRRVLLDTEIRLIDFGSATFDSEYHSTVVSTRHYRAPEIIMGLGWSYPCDIWSIGCILVEFFTGDALFQTHDNLEHLAMMEAVIGTRIDSYLVQNVNKMSTRNGGNSAAKYFKRLKLDYPTPATTRGSRRFVKAMKRIEDIIPAQNAFFKNFIDLLRKIFVYDPARRITAKEALVHPFFKDPAPPDDGTEASKIRAERERRDAENRKNATYVE